jgi:uncharacterized protein YeaO (DUF488 family)
MAAKRALDIRIKRAYEPPAPADGARVLVDRLWPRGVSKKTLALDRWDKEIAPSDALRRWFGHDPARWEEFRRRYKAELKQHATLLEALRELAGRAPLTLVYGAQDEAHNDAVVLREVLGGAVQKKTPAAKAAAGAISPRNRRVNTRRAAARPKRRSPRQ